ncbi:unnamed protein product [Chilo suppressalis]|uniref:ATPase AAA-type core domain-containing protein n=1 Tax=Chilo suppressalis TaxID=168631 RepID=A0ABN8EEX3_CHISP|nr:unnamed protein product [Chilo suppressalis]
MAAMIQAHERSRQLIKLLTHQRQKRQMWEKELRGTLKSQAPHELKERSAKLIQKAFRAYFDIKRRRILQCKEDEILGMRLSGNMNKDTMYQQNYKRLERRKQLEQEWITSRENLKQKFMESKFNDFTEDYRDFIRSWFRRWFDDIKYFHDMPRESEGGSVLIMKDELLDPAEWWDEYERYLAEKKSKKNQSALQRKYAEMQAKEEAMMKKREERMKKKLETELKRKLMKNPTLHPGYHYPQSKKTENILEVIKSYRNDWSDLDFCNRMDVKEKFVQDIDVNNVYAKVKREIMTTVDNDMRNELKLLKSALEKDFDKMEEKMPEPMNKRKGRKSKKTKKLKCTMSEDIAEKLEDLAFKGILKQYPRTELKVFLGDHNYAGDDIRCDNEPAHPLSGELRAVWWERCREVSHGAHQILIVGPPRSGKTVLINALASVNDAVLFVLDPYELHTLPTAELHKIVNSVIACARAVQPCVIYTRHVHKLYYKKMSTKTLIT